MFELSGCTLLKCAIGLWVVHYRNAHLAHGSCIIKYTFSLEPFIVKTYIGPRVMFHQNTLGLWVVHHHLVDQGADRVVRHLTSQGISPAIR